MSDMDMVRLIIKFIIFGVIVGVLWWVIDYCIEHPKINKVAHIVLVILAALWLCRMLLALNP